MGIRKKIVPIHKPISPILTIPRRKTNYLKTYPITGFKNHRGLDIPKWDLHISNKNTMPYNLLMGR